MTRNNDSQQQLRPRPFSNRRDERGAALVEAGLVLVPLILLLMGLIEFATLLKQTSSVEATTRNGARIAQVNSQQSDFYTSVIAEVTSRGAGVHYNVGDRLLIYKATAEGVPTGNTAATASPVCTTSCQEYRWAATGFGAKVAGSGWTVTTQKACLADTDTVGVMIVHDYRSTTKLFSFLNRKITERSTARLEPVDEVC